MPETTPCPEARHKPPRTGTLPAGSGTLWSEAGAAKLRGERMDPRPPVSINHPIADVAHPIDDVEQGDQITLSTTN